MYKKLFEKGGLEGRSPSNGLLLVVMLAAVPPASPPKGRFVGPYRLPHPRKRFSNSLLGFSGIACAFTA
jgi:hypothetical protein